MNANTARILDPNEHGHSTASRLQNREGSCGSSPATCPCHRSEFFLPEASVTKQKNKSVRFESTATMNADIARLRGFETERIGTVPHLPPAPTTDLIISYLKLV
jgi:hypothetical protein